MAFMLPVCYPSTKEGNEDAFEVRFIEPGGMVLRYEQFLGRLAPELEEIINPSVMLGDAMRLEVQALAESDPLAF
jgi:hypothetical protein